MYRNKTTGAYPVSRDDIQAEYPNTTLPAELSAEELDHLGFDFVLPTSRPAHDPVVSSIAETAPGQANDGTWRQAWAVTPLNEATANANRVAQREAIWARIKAERDCRVQSNGYMVGAKWFHSDTFSRSQQMGLVMACAAIPTSMQWKTMDGSFVTMTQTLAAQIFQAAMGSDMAIFTKAETLKAQVQAASDPASVDIMAGWPKGYGE